MLPDPFSPTFESYEPAHLLTNGAGVTNLFRDVVDLFRGHGDSPSRRGASPG